MFLDEARIYVKGGDGGAGAVAFRREKYVPRGGPAGGDGGNGGNVVLAVNPRLNTLTHFQKKVHFKAEKGHPGGNFNRSGAAGEDLVIEVPPGTIVRDAQSGALLADLTQADQRVVVAQGGRGGRGNARFKTSTHQAPRMAEKGEPGEERWIALELKLIADVGIVGVPNAGKSTLISVISAAKPKIASYPFTTLEPNLGVAVVGGQELVFADIPGLVEGAHAGVGLGHSFLRHVQRTRILVHLLDGAGQDPIGDFVQINSELALFDPALAEKPQIVALTKMDLPEARERWPEVQAAISARGLPVLAISAVTHEGVQELLNLVVETYSALPETAPTEEVPVFRPDEEETPFRIFKVGEGVYRVTGERIERAASMTYWEYEEAVMRFQRILKALGITEALERAGVQEGDTVIIADVELEWSD